jgi:hypothetical protein
MWVHLKWKEDEGQARLSHVRELSEALDNAAVGGVHADNAGAKRKRHDFRRAFLNVRSMGRVMREPIGSE